GQLTVVGYALRSNAATRVSILYSQVFKNLLGVGSGAKTPSTRGSNSSVKVSPGNTTRRSVRGIRSNVSLANLLSTKILRENSEMIPGRSPLFVTARITTSLVQEIG